MSRARFMVIEELPVEVIGLILSRLRCPRDAIRASMVSCKCREAFRRNLHTLSFNCFDDRCFYGKFSSSRIEELITLTIFQANGLQDLTILMPKEIMLSDSIIIAWLMHTRETLRQLHYGIEGKHKINVLDICGKKKLEVLSISYNSLLVRPSLHRFPCLTSLSLSHLTLLVSHLNYLLNACPKLESLKLVCLKFPMLIGQVVELISPTLRTVFIQDMIQDMNMHKFVLKVNSIQYLHLKCCKLDQIELRGKGSLKHMKFEKVSIRHLNVGESIDNLEILDVNSFTIVSPKICQMISNLSKLKRLRLCSLFIPKEDDAIIDFGRIAARFPQLTYLSLNYHLQFGNLGERGFSVLNYHFRDAIKLEKVVILELLSCAVDGSFWGWVEELLRSCPNVKKLIIHGNFNAKVGEFKMLSDYNSSMVKVVRKYMHVDVQFVQMDI